MITLGIDVGGTFTDMVILDEEKNRIVVGKCLTTPDDPSIGVIRGAVDLLRKNGIPMRSVHHIVHGTTLVANALIERKGPKTGLITTKGFRDILEMAKECRFDSYDLFLARPKPLVPRYLRKEVSERLLSDGSVLRPLDLQDVRSVASEFKTEGVKAVAVCLLHSYRNPSHENAIGELLEEEFPEFYVTLSSKVAPEIKEYERCSTATVNAYVQPLVEKYLGTLEKGLRAQGFEGRIYCMLSDGGIVPLEVAGELPVRLAESGPVAGTIACSYYGDLVGIRDIISFDMGGTTAKAAKIDDGQPSYSSELEVARVYRFKKGSGLPLRLPAVEMLETGAGGGSIAYIDHLGLLKVGPESAGADPGPACYDRGGSKPTVSDAQLLLGYLNPDYFLGGEMKLNVQAAESSINKEVASRLNIDTVSAAIGIFDVVNESMSGAIRVHIAERGGDPRRYTLMAYGGAGPIHAYSLCKILKIKRVIYPLFAGVISAFGMLVARKMLSLVRSHVSRLSEIDWVSLGSVFQSMESQGRQVLLGAGVEVSAIKMSRTVDMRYVGQGYEVSVPLDGVSLNSESLKDITQAFYTSYETQFGHLVPDTPVEIVNCRVVVSSASPQINPGAFFARPKSTKDALKGKRKLYLPDLKQFGDCPVYDRYALSPGTVLKGPALFEERESTVVVGTDATVHVDNYLNLIVDVA